MRDKMIKTKTFCDKNENKKLRMKGQRIKGKKIHIIIKEKNKNKTKIIPQKNKK